MSATATTMMGTFGMTDFLMPLVLEDLTEEDFNRQSRGEEGPSIAWSVGHILHYRYSVLNVLGDERQSPFGTTFTDDATGGDGYPSLDEFKEAWAAIASDFSGALMSTSEADWDASGEGPHAEKSLRDQITFFAWHEGYHMGAIGALRKQLGYLGPAEKVMAAREAEEVGAAD